MLRKIVKRAFPHAVPVVNRSSSANTVLILGYAGSEPRNYNKLLRYYKSKNVSTVLQVMPMFCPEFIRMIFEDEIETSVRGSCMAEYEHQKNEHSDHRLLVQVYSNNGSWNYASLCKHNKLPLVPTKLLIDAAPSFWYDEDTLKSHQLHALANVLTSIIRGKAEYEVYPLTNILRFIIFRSSGLYNFIRRWQGERRWLTDFMSLNIYFRDNSPKIPTAFVYSSGDKLVPMEDIQQFKEAYSKAHNIACPEIVFGDDVGHTSAFFKKPTEYAAFLDSFFWEEEMGAKKEKDTSK